MTAEERVLAAETVERAFRLILGRPPESPETLEFHRRLGSEEALRAALIRSPEFGESYVRLVAERLAQKGAPGEAAPEDLAKHADERPGTVPMKLARGILPEQGPVETDCPPGEAAALWTRIAESWTAMGTEAAHWSVLTHDLFRPETLEANRALFEGTAAVEGMLVDAAIERAPGFDPRSARAIEIGCGVGRATRALAERFAHVTGYDISAPHLEIAARELAAAGHDNVELRQMTGPADWAGLSGYGFAYSRLVLQHNPPPVQAAILRGVLAGLEPGGLALFQAVTYGRHYRYRAADDLSGAPGRMEMHVLPQPAVFALMAEAGVAPLEVQEDFAAGRDGPFRSHLFLGRKA